jgi:hypothetical protein
MELEDGVELRGLTPEGNGWYFVRRASIIIEFSDIPAIAKMLFIRAHNALTPCRTCYIQGEQCQLERNAVYYVPLTDPYSGVTFPIDLLPMRTHELTLAHLDQLDAMRNKTARDEFLQDCGITGRSIFSYLKSIELASSFTYDIMHLLFENLVLNMIHHRIGEFKGLDQGEGIY